MIADAVLLGDAPTASRDPTRTVGVGDPSIAFRPSEEDEAKACSTALRGLWDVLKACEADSGAEDEGTREDLAEGGRRLEVEASTFSQDIVKSFGGSGVRPLVGRGLASSSSPC